MPPSSSVPTQNGSTGVQFHPAVERWFGTHFEGPTPAQRQGWPPILEGKSTLLLAPTGSGKTLAAFLTAIDALMFSPVPPAEHRLRVLYISPLKALGVDVERNLQAPIVGIAKAAEEMALHFHRPAVAVRSGDTPPRERARFLRTPTDILITTPESLYLLLTSQAHRVLTSVDTLIVDEIHSLVSTKRGAHLFLSIERLEAIRTSARPLQRIGLSATQRPLPEVARLLGGGVVDAAEAWIPRPVEIVDAGIRKPLEIIVELPEEDPPLPGAPGPAGEAKSRWTAIHPRLVELVRSHRSTLIFVNSRRLAERLATALNDLAEDQIALAHHGSLAPVQRKEIEERLKAGNLPALVATSSLELGIDMGAVDLVVQIESPPSIAAGLQRIGRAGHSLGAVSAGVILPKHRGDLLACAAAVSQMLRGEVEETYYPRNPLDVLAQQMVAQVASAPTTVDSLFRQMRGAAPFADLPRSSFEGVLDLLSGRYPSDEFAGLRPRLVWDRSSGLVRGRPGTKQLAIVNGGTIPDRGLYGVFLADSTTKSNRRVGELDEEMVFESRPGEVFLLGASSWRIEEITHDRVLVTPAPGEPGKMPFWHGDRPGRSADFGQAIGALTGRLTELPQDAACDLLRTEHALDERAARGLVNYLHEQQLQGALPTDQSLVIEQFPDALGDPRICILSPFGARVHAPWALALGEALKAAGVAGFDTLWSDDGIALRLPEADRRLSIDLLLPDPDQVEAQVVQALGSSSLFAAHFRENAARSLLLPRRRPGVRSPLWAQRRRSADLLSVAAQYPSFPILLETYRDCLQDVFDLPALIALLRRIRSGTLQVIPVATRRPSPFAASLLFSYVANFMYAGDAPLAERRAQALTIDHRELRELLGEVALRTLFDRGVISDLEKELQHLGARRARHADRLQEVLLDLGDLDFSELVARSDPPEQCRTWLAQLTREGRVFEIAFGHRPRWVAAEDLGRLRDALGIAPPTGVPQALLQPTVQPLQELLARYARTHGPFTPEDVARRYGLNTPAVLEILVALERAGRLTSGEFLPEGTGREWCDPHVLKRLKQRTLARLRKDVEPVDPASFARFLASWHHLDRPGFGSVALEGALDQLEGAPIAVSVLLNDVLPARVTDFTVQTLDLLCAAGSLFWQGVEPLGANDGKIALYRPERLHLLPPVRSPATSSLAKELRQILSRRGALFFGELVREAAASLPAFAPDVLKALWELVWAGEVTNDTLAPLRSLQQSAESNRSPRPLARRSRDRGRNALPGSEGRWSLISVVTGATRSTETERRVALTEQLLVRSGIVVREAVQDEGIPGGFSAVYEVLKALEEAGKVRRGYFVAGLGATQFAEFGAEDRLRAGSHSRGASLPLILAAMDPANPYGAALPWPEGAPRPGRTAGAYVVLVQGDLVGFLARGGHSLTTFLPGAEPARTEAARSLAGALGRWLEKSPRRALFLTAVDGVPVDTHYLAPFLREAGFSRGSQGYLKRTESPFQLPSQAPDK